MRIASNGNVGIGDSAPDVALDVVGSIYYTGTITDVSDRRLKENVLDLSDSLNKVCQLNAKSYTLIADRDNEEEEVELGFIAQEVQTVFPEVVKNIQKYVVDENGENTEEEINYLGVSYIQLVAPMVEAIKELKTEVDTLKAKVTALEAANGS
jgi:trimeric autotransporter adhesin